jgi:pyridoxine/pyridoxamine 5'-phosphate oxidase
MWQNHLQSSSGHGYSRSVTAKTVLKFIRTQRLAVVATTTEDGRPQAALIGIAVTDDARIVFDTSEHSRKYRNLQKHKVVALVVGWDNDITVQLEAVAEDTSGDDLERCKDAYFAVYPDGREHQTWPDITYVVVRISWMRYCDYNAGGIGSVEYSF